MSSEWLHPREELVRTMARIYRYRMTTTSGGNLSVRDPDGGIWITPSRVDKGSLTPDDVVRVLPDGRREGRHPPSSEFPFHRRIYEARPEFGAIVHAHPGSLVAFSVCRLLPELGVHVHAFEVCRKVAMAAYACPGSEQLGERIAEAFASGAMCVVLENHGVVIGGTDLRDAFQRFETLEFVAQTIVKASALGVVRRLPEEKLTHRPRPEWGALPQRAVSNSEKALRAQICRFVHRAYEQRLLVSTAGAFSARLDGDEFLVTPTRRDRLELEPSGVVRATRTACEAGKEPSRAALLHAAIYERLPDVGAIVSAQPAHASAFCLTATRLTSRTIPESYIVLEDAPTLPFACIVEQADEIAARFSLKKCPVVLIENEGVTVIGRDVLEAFDRLEVLEATAEALLLARPLGPLVPMPGEALSELRTAFGMD
jgi:L-fuculose-phosphate aldolase